MIKNIFLITFICLIGTTSAMGQSYIGVFAGVNMSKLAGDTQSKTKYKNLMGANVGANLDIKLGKSIYLSLQPSYSQEGTKVSYTIDGQDDPVDSLSIRLNYFSFPLLVKITSTNERFYAVTGVETAFLMGSSITTGEVKEDLDVNVSDFNVAMHFGVGINIPLGFPKMFVEVRYTQGLINLTDEPLKDDLIPRVKTSGLKILAGVQFPLNKTQN